jgi:hypothetical protein
MSWGFLYATFGMHNMRAVLIGILLLVIIGCGMPWVF